LKGYNHQFQEKSLEYKATMIKVMSPGKGQVIYLPDEKVFT
jgi:hypothetical protein